MNQNANTPKAQLNLSSLQMVLNLEFLILTLNEEVLQGKRVLIKMYTFPVKYPSHKLRERAKLPALTV